jgi:hypothetical protein
MKKLNVKNWPVMDQCCPTCPFRTMNDPLLVAEIQRRVLTEGSQVCHHPRLHGGKQTHLCRGARDFQLIIFSRLGVIENATDEAWKKAQQTKTKERTAKYESVKYGADTRQAGDRQT